MLTVGEGDVGQLGLGEDVMERERPALVDIPDPVIQVYGGGMHTVCLTEKGEVLHSFLYYNRPLVKRVYQKNKFSYFSTKTYVVVLKRTVSVSTQNICSN